MFESDMNEHKCKKVSHQQNDEDIHIKIQCFNGNWVLHRFRFACDKCVYDGEAQYEGELFTICDVAINFCPYCGSLLNEKLSGRDIPAKEFDYGQNHTCSYLEEYNQKFPHVGFSFDTDALWKISKEFGGWSLERHSVATERMALAEEADKNELVLWYATVIDYCPFCGLKLLI